MERLDKVLAAMGVGTRSETKKYLKAGRVTVNGVITKAGEYKVDPDLDEIVFDGKKLTFTKYEYHMLYKPQGCVTATEDKKDPTVMDYIQSDRKKKLFPVGRLDKDTEGLLLITDDGELAHRLLAPKKHVDKAYFARVSGQITEKDIQTFAKGMDIGDEKLTLPAKLEILKRTETQTEVVVTISEGRFHQIKRMFAAIGSEVLFLKRLTMGPLMLDEELNPGESRRLTREEEAMITAIK